MYVQINYYNNVESANIILHWQSFDGFTMRNMHNPSNLNLSCIVDNTVFNYGSVNGHYRPLHFDIYRDFTINHYIQP